MNYINKKNWKKGNNQMKIKGSHMFKHQDDILEMERDGSPQQKVLKKCLDDAI